MFDQRSAQLAGAIAIAAFAVAAAALLVLGRIDVRPRIDATIYFENIGALQEGTDVQVAGTPIGRVESVELVPARRIARPDHPLAGTGGVAVRVTIQERYLDRAPANGEYFINFKGLLGASYVEIGPPPDDQRSGPALADGAELRGIDPPLLDRVLLRSFQNLTSSREFLAALGPEVRALGQAVSRLTATVDEIEPAEGAYAALIASSREVSDQARVLTDRFDGDPIDIAQLQATAAGARRLFDRVDAELAQLEGEVATLRRRLAAIRDKIPPDLVDRFQLAADRTAQAVARGRAIAAQGRALMAAVDAGEGTVGKLLSDPEFIDDAKKLGKILKRQPWGVIGHPPDE